MCVVQQVSKGLGGAMTFLLMVGKFGDEILTRRAKNSESKRQVCLTALLCGIFSRACCRNVGYASACLGVSSVFRVLGSVWVFRQWGKIAGALLARRMRRITRLVVELSVVTLVLAFLRALRKQHLAYLGEDIRAKLTQWCHARYMRDAVFYKVNKVSGAKIENFDQRITSDIERFSSMFVQVMSQLLMRVVEVLVYSVALSCTQGVATPLTIYTWSAFAAFMSTTTRPAVEKLAKRKQTLEDQFRQVHTDLTVNCEQIALLGGEQFHMKIINQKFQEVFDHSLKCINSPCSVHMLWEDMKKYFACVISLALICRSLQLSLNTAATFPTDLIIEHIVPTWRVVEAVSTSIQDLFGLINRVDALSFTAVRVNALMDALERRHLILSKEITAVKPGPNPPTLKSGKELKFEHVSVYRPDGRLLVKDLNFSVGHCQRLLITGRDGCGKSGLVRTIRNLWPLVEGTITVPAGKGELYVIPQANYMPSIALRNLIVYPQCIIDEVQVMNCIDDNIFQALKWAHVSPLVRHNGQAELQFTLGNQIVQPGLADTHEWERVLSPAQKQKLGFARLFYHRPGYAVLDDCTSGISFEVERELYERCSALNIAILSISQKEELKELHDSVLHVGDPAGSWQLLSCSKQPEASGVSVRSG